MNDHMMQSCFQIIMQHKQSTLSPIGKQEIQLAIQKVALERNKIIYLEEGNTSSLQIKNFPIVGQLWRTNSESGKLEEN